MSTPEQPDVAQHRDYLYRYALLQLRDASRADDVVQLVLQAKPISCSLLCEVGEGLGVHRCAITTV